MPPERERQPVVLIGAFEFSRGGSLVGRGRPGRFRLCCRRARNLALAGQQGQINQDYDHDQGQAGTVDPAMGGARMQAMALPVSTRP